MSDNWSVDLKSARYIKIKNSKELHPIYHDSTNHENIKRDERKFICEEVQVYIVHKIKTWEDLSDREEKQDGEEKQEREEREYGNVGEYGYLVFLRNIVNKFSDGSDILNLYFPSTMFPSNNYNQITNIISSLIYLFITESYLSDPMKLIPISKIRFSIPSELIPIYGVAILSQYKDLDPTNS